MILIAINRLHSTTAMLQLIILLSIFNSLIWFAGLADVVSTCSRQPKLITRDNNDLYHFFTFYLDAGMQ